LRDEDIRKNDSLEAEESEPGFGQFHAKNCQGCAGVTTR
jgi:hypothetical protein